MGWNSTIYIKDSIRWYLGKSVQIENTWVWSTQIRIRMVRNGDSSKDTDAQLSKIEDDGEMIRNSDCETLTPDTGKSKQEQWSRVERAEVALKEEKEDVTSGKEKASVRRETRAVSGMRVMIVHQNRHRKPLHPLSHQWHEEKARRGKVIPEAEVRLAQFFDNRADTIWKVLVRDHLVSVGSYCENCTSIGLWSIGETRGVKFWDQFDGYDSHSPRYVKQVSEKIKVRRSDKFEAKFVISAVRTLWNLRISLRKKLIERSDAPAGTRGYWPRIS